MPAPVRKDRSLLWYLPAAVLALAIVFGVLAARRVWGEIHEQDEPASNEERLDELRRAYVSGQMDEAEFQRISAILAGSEAVASAKRPGAPADPGPRPGGSRSRDDELPA